MSAHRHITGHVCAIDDDGLVHAMEATLLQWTACGRDGVRLVIVGSEDGDGVTLRWVPRRATLPDGLIRCAACMEAASTREYVDWPSGELVERDA